jgi:hypothetical protein
MKWPWNDKFHMEFRAVPYGFHGIIPYGFHGIIPYGFHGIIPYGFHGIIPYGFHGMIQYSTYKSMLLNCYIVLTRFIVFLLIKREKKNAASEN